MPKYVAQATAARAALYFTHVMSRRVGGEMSVARRRRRRVGGLAAAAGVPGHSSGGFGCAGASERPEEGLSYRPAVSSPLRLALLRILAWAEARVRMRLSLYRA